MKIVILIARILLGLIFTVFGLNGFLHFVPQQPLPAGPAGQFIGALASAKLYIGGIFAIQLLCGILFLLNRYVPLALTLIAPIIVNILLFHLSMALSGIPPGALAAILWFIVAHQYRYVWSRLREPQPSDNLSVRER